MTLNITLLTERAMYQSADFRLTNADTGAVITDTFLGQIIEAARSGRNAVTEA